MVGPKLDARSYAILILAMLVVGLLSYRLGAQGTPTYTGEEQTYKTEAAALSEVAHAIRDVASSNDRIASALGEVASAVGRIHLEVGGSSESTTTTPADSSPAATGAPSTPGTEIKFD